VTSDTLQTSKVKRSKVKVTRDVTYQQYKRYKSGTDRLTEFKLGDTTDTCSVV